MTDPTIATLVRLLSEARHEIAELKAEMRIMHKNHVAEQWKTKLDPTYD